MNALELRDVTFGWRPGKLLLQIDALDVASGGRLFIRGPSGSGKSTLLGLMGGVLTPTSGTVRVLGESLGELGAARRDALRVDRIGFIFQMFNLLPYLSVRDNVTLPCRFSARRRERALAGGADVETEAERLLGRLGLADSELLGRRVTELSIGQQQRVAAARALIGKPDLVIADEPTSSLDADARGEFLDLLMSECRSAGSAIVFVSHDQSLARHFDRQLALGELNRARRRSAA
ncbi:MAG: ABC transporter ATP-binding protein [Gammaproteobacteria bacterium]